jgi:hypothetical protein
VTPNDPLDLDLGSNDLQNYPVLQSVSTSGSTTRVRGLLESSPNTDFTVDFYSSSTCNASGFGEGETYFGSAAVTTDSSGRATIDETLGVATPAGAVVTATATNEDGSTSEFSRCIAVNSAVAAGKGEALAEAGEPPLELTAPDPAARQGGTVLLTFQPPNAATGGALAPPRYLQAAEVCGGSKAATLGAWAARSEALASPPAARQGSGEVIGYKVYTSTEPGVDPDEDDLLATLPPTQTSATVPAGGRAFFVVTACYPEGESEPSNEASTGADAATLRTIKITNTKIVAKGGGFSQPVSVEIDTSAFATGSKVKGAAKVVQKGALASGETIFEYMNAHGGQMLITFRNAGGGVTSLLFRAPSKRAARER